MSKKPNLLKSLGDMAAKQEAAKSTKRDAVMETPLDLSKEIPESEVRAKPAAGKPLPKVTLYAHQDVLKAIRHLAVEDGVQAQEILRAAVRDYLERRGHAFIDLATGQRA